MQPDAPSTSPAAGGAGPTPGEPAAMSILFAELASGKATRRSVAVAYAMLIGAWAGQPGMSLAAAHDAMRDALKLDLDGLDRLKATAWTIYDATLARRAALDGCGRG